MIITREDPFTGKTHSLDLPITAEQITRWENGELIQNVFPHLNSDQREFMITGIPPGKWEEYLGHE